jgi:hypothetical protein
MASSPSNEETIIMENYGIKTIVHEMKVNGHHLVERKTLEGKQKTSNNPNAFDRYTRMNIITHSRSIDDRSYSYTVQGSLAEGQSQVVETQMTQEEVEKFKEDWRNLWKPQKEANLPHFISLHFD